jgi:hypothetical protein
MSHVHVGATLIQLPKADDVGGELWDEVHPREWDVLAGLPLK